MHNKDTFKKWLKLEINKRLQLLTGVSLRMCSIECYRNWINEYALLQEVLVEYEKQSNQ